MRRTGPRVVLLAVGLLVTGAFTPAPTSAAARGASLAVWSGGAWRTWWRADRAPAEWSAPDSTLLRAVRWRRIGPGLEWATVLLSCAAPAWRSKLIIARLDPRLLDLSLEFDMTRDMRPAWSLERAPGDAILAVNAGQFVGGMPWGWVVRDGSQRLGPRGGPLASAISIDPSGRIRWAHGDSLLAPNGAVTAFQSYPTLLADGALPPPLRKPGLGVSHTHRDARLAIGETRDGRLLLVLTRFDAMGEITGALPLGPTTPEMAAILGALGARDAVMLDGGISAQLLIRDPGRKSPYRWPGMRKVPLALIARAR